jgi:methyl-accepting chemotaxis protein
VARWFGLICLAALALFGAVAWFASQAVARPIQHLTRVADRVSKGHLDDIELAALEARQDEIGELAQAVTRLVVSFKAALGMLKKRQPS